MSILFVEENFRKDESEIKIVIYKYVGIVLVKL